MRFDRTMTVRPGIPSDRLSDLAAGRPVVIGLGALPRSEGPIWVEVEVGDRWRAALRLVPRLGQPVIAEVRLFPRDSWPGRRPGQWRDERFGPDRLSDPACVPIRNGITVADLHGVPMREVRAFARSAIAQARRFDEAPPASAPTPEWTPRPRGWTDARYARIAAAYVRALDAGSRRPVADAARSVRLKPTQVRDALHRARARGLLTQTNDQGLPGGELTETARRLLARRKGTAKR